MSQISSQNTAILAHLRTGNTVTQTEAYHAFGCTRLSARIYDLRKRLEDEGEKEAIDSVSIPFTARSGKKGRYCRYYLKRLQSEFDYQSMVPIEDMIEDDPDFFKTEEGPQEQDPCDLAHDYQEMVYGSDSPSEYDPS